MMARSSIAITAAFTLIGALAGCATPTAYQPTVAGHAAQGGYSEFRVEANRWRVTFAGNSLTSRETVETYLLFRSAELTAQQGFDWFSIADRSTQDKGYAYVESYGPHLGWSPTWRFHRRGFRHRAFDPFFDDSFFFPDRFDVRTVDRFEATAEIVMGHGAKPASDPRAFDARQVIANLQPRIRYPEARG